jgi:hypothetical protein
MINDEEHEGTRSSILFPFFVNFVSSVIMRSLMRAFVVTSKRRNAP